MRSHPGKQRLGQILLELGLLSPERLASALAEQRKAGGREVLGQILLRLGWLRPAELRHALAQQYLRWALGAAGTMLVGAHPLTALAAESAGIVIRVVVPPRAAALSVTAPNAGLDLAGKLVEAPLAGLPAPAAGPYQVTLVSASAAQFGSPHFVADGIAGVGYRLSIDGRPVQFENGRALLGTGATEARPARSSRLAITTAAGVPPTQRDTLQVVVRVN